MLNNWIRVTLRNLLKNKVYFIINLFGLTLGISCALMVFILYLFYNSTDLFHPEADRIYRVVHILKNTNTGTTERISQAPHALAPQIRENFPQIQATSVYHQTWPVVVSIEKNGQLNKIQQRTSFVEPEFFDLFPFPFAIGTPEALREPYSAVLSASTAAKLFGDDDPIGKVINWNNEFDVKVTGIVQDFPRNSNFPFECMISNATLYQRKNQWLKDDWNIDWFRMVFVKLPEGFVSVKLIEKLNALNRNKLAVERYETQYELQPLSEVHADVSLMNFAPKMPPNVYLILRVVGVLLILTACINFINLATAHSVQRCKEVGIRKVLGVTKKGLLSQFVGEAAVVTLFAVVLSWVVVDISMKQLAGWVGLEAPTHLLSSPVTLAALGALFVFISLLSGFYPAWVIARFEPVLALKNHLHTGHTGGLQLRKALVVIQFVISQIMLLFMVAIFQQMLLFREAELGYNKANTLMLRLPDAGYQRASVLKAQVKALGNVEQASLSFFPPSDKEFIRFKYFFENGQGRMAENWVYCKFSDPDYLDTYQIPLLAGRNVSPSDTLNEIVINETMMRQMGFADPAQAVGQHIEIHNNEDKIYWKNKTIVGVAHDFATGPLRTEIFPTLIGSNAQYYYRLNVRFAPGSRSQILADLETAWEKAFPEYYFDPIFIEDMVDRFYENEERLAHLIYLFSVITLLIGCIGLFGLVSFLTTHKTKEIGIRKILGASWGTVLAMLSKEYLWLVLCSFAIASPIGYYVLDNVILSQFAYRIELGFAVFLVAFLSSALIAVLTVGLKSYQAARANPVTNLRSE